MLVILYGDLEIRDWGEPERAPYGLVAKQVLRYARTYVRLARNFCHLIKSRLQL